MQSVTQENAVLRVARPEDLRTVEALLAAADLPAKGVAEWLPHFVVAEAGGTIVGAAGLEVYRSDGLLRSVAVANGWRGRGIGSALTAAVLAAARRHGLRAVYLLTETAESYFPKHGFRRIARSEVPEPVTHSVEFRELCPTSSIVMVTDLGDANGVEGT